MIDLLRLRRIQLQQQQRRRQNSIRLRLAKVERYDERKPRFLQTNDVTTTTTPVISIRQKTTIFGFLLIVCQFAMVDQYHLLPTGIMIYIMGIGCLVEILQYYDGEEDISIVFSFPWSESESELSLLDEEYEYQRQHQYQYRDEHQRGRQQQQQQRYRDEEHYDRKRTRTRRIHELETIQDQINFEYFVLKGEHRAPKVIAREEDGIMVYYTL